eukprot:3904248-Rhodomonas_salina.1
MWYCEHGTDGASGTANMVLMGRVVLRTGARLRAKRRRRSPRYHAPLRTPPPISLHTPTSLPTHTFPSFPTHSTLSLRTSPLAHVRLRVMCGLADGRGP